MSTVLKIMGDTEPDDTIVEFRLAKVMDADGHVAIEVVCGRGLNSVVVHRYVVNGEGNIYMERIGGLGGGVHPLADDNDRMVVENGLVTWSGMRHD